MMTLKALMVLVFLTFTEGLPETGLYSRLFMSNIHPTNIREKLKILPAPMPGFDLSRWLGQWHFQYHKAPCSWAISEEFTDYSQDAVLHGNEVLYHETMRNQGMCNSVTSPVAIRGPGVFTGKDIVGDNWSGKIVVPSTDYISYSIGQGCTKVSAFDGTCDDGWLYVKTRDIIPSPKWLGQWHFQYHKAPCSWAISEEFTDYSQDAVLHGNEVLYHETMRNQGMCNSVTSPVAIRGPGVFTGKDIVGDNWSGKIVVPSTDYISYSIGQGCTKVSAFDGTCDDGWLYVKTRDIIPSPKVLNRIEFVLQKIWGISINQLTRIRHENPCSYRGKVVG